MEFCFRVNRIPLHPPPIPHHEILKIMRQNGILWLKISYSSILLCITGLLCEKPKSLRLTWFGASPEFIVGVSAFIHTELVCKATCCDSGTLWPAMRNYCGWFPFSVCMCYIGCDSHL